MHTEFTARNVAKFILKSIVATKTADLTAETIAEHTNFEEDDMVVDLGSKVFGWYVSDRLKPVTDKIVDSTADFVTEKREARKAKKDAKKD
jgi:hypothetical protein